MQPTKKQKLFLMLWCPDDAKIKAKMLYSSSFDALKKSLTGVAKYVEVSEPVAKRLAACYLPLLASIQWEVARCVWSLILCVLTP